MDRVKKLTVLRRLAEVMQDDTGAVVPVLAFLAGRLDYVHFVADTEGATVWIRFSVMPRVWPRLPFRAEVDGMRIQHPVALIERLALRDDPIYVRTDFGVAGIPEWYEEVLEPGVQDPREYLEASLEKIREDIDLALDVYRAANENMQRTEGEAREVLRFALSKARADIRTLTNRLQTLEAQMGQGRR